MYIQSLCSSAELSLKELKWMEVDDFRRYLHEHIDIGLQVSYTESFNYVALDHLSQGIPVVGSEAIEYLPWRWKANVDDIQDIAAKAQIILADYEFASELACSVARGVIEANNTEMVHTISRMLGKQPRPAVSVRRASAALPEPILDSEPASLMFSIVILTHDRLELLKLAIESCLQQQEVSPDDYEILIVDNGSTDGTEEYIRELDDDRIRYVKIKETSIPAARNIGIKMARGEWLIPLDDDDELPPTRLTETMAGMCQDGTGCIYGDYVLFDEEGETYKTAGAFRVTRLFVGRFMSHPAMTVRRDMLKRIGGYDETVPAAVDYDLQLRLHVAGCIFQYVPKSFARVRKHPGQMSRHRRAEQVRCARMVKHRVLKLSGSEWRRKRTG